MKNSSKENINKVRCIVRQEVKKLFEADYYDSFPDFLDPQYNPQIGAYPPVGITNYGSMMKEEIDLDVETEEEKPYRFYMLCDKLCQTEGVEVKNQMIKDAEPVSREEFIENCAYAESMLYYQQISKETDPSMGFYKSEVKGIPCYFVQYAGFEFIFIKNGKPGKEYWLDEMWDEEGKWIY